MKEVLDDIERWRSAGHRVAVARVVGVEGSGPREPGATMAVNDEGEVAGSVSGGCVEGAVVVILSDGWDRGDPELLGAQMERLHRVAHQVVWVNPLKSSPNFAPLARGMAAALPHVDEFVEGHNLASLEQLARIVSGEKAERQR